MGPRKIQEKPKRGRAGAIRKRISANAPPPRRMDLGARSDSLARLSGRVLVGGAKRRHLF